MPKFSNNKLTKMIDKIDNWIEESVPRFETNGNVL